MRRGHTRTTENTPPRQGIFLLGLLGGKRQILYPSEVVFSRRGAGPRFGNEADESQRALVAARIASMRQGERTDLASIDAKLS